MLRKEARVSEYDNAEPLPKGCGYTGKHFGAPYEDAKCFGGILYDLDDCDSHGNLYEPLNQIPCPKCCHSAWLATFEDLTINKGYEAASCGGPKVNPFENKEARLLYEEDRSQLAVWWAEGWNEFHRDRKNLLNPPESPEGSEKDPCVSP